METSDEILIALAIVLFLCCVFNLMLWTCDIVMPKQRQGLLACHQPCNMGRNYGVFD